MIRAEALDLVAMSGLSGVIAHTKLLGRNKRYFSHTPTALFFTTTVI